MNPNGQAATWYFEYGKTTGYGSKSAIATNAGAGPTSDVATHCLADRARSRTTTYHYRLRRDEYVPARAGEPTASFSTLQPAVEAVTNPATKTKGDARFRRRSTGSSIPTRPHDDVVLRVRHPARATARKQGAAECRCGDAGQCDGVPGVDHRV